MSESKEINIGRAGEFIVMADLLMRGEKAFLTDQGANYDIIIERPNRFIRLQVKATLKPGRMNRTYATSTYLFHAKRAGKGGKRNYATNEFEGFALVALDTRQVAYLVFDQIITRTIILRDRRQSYKINAGHLAPYFDEFGFDAFIKNFTNGDAILEATGQTFRALEAENGRE